MEKARENNLRKPTKTISGIAPVAVMLPPRKCEHGCCVYCPNLNVPQSYTPRSPVVLRASAWGYDSYKQVVARLETLEAMGHSVEKVELIIMGGTFLQYPMEFQNKFVKGLYDGLNCRKSKTLKDAKKLNETARHRCVALCIETRPDVIDVERMLEFGCTRVELGVQIIDDKIYEKVSRGHKIKDVVDATKVLKNAGFKIGYHIMPGLPGSNIKKDLKLFKKMFSDSKFKPDQLKLYPCQVMPCSELEKIYWKGKYKPYTKEETEKVLLAMLKVVPNYCRVMRMMREIPPEYIVAGTIHIDLRKDIEELLRGSGTQGCNRKGHENLQAGTPNTLKGTRNIRKNIFTKGKEIKEIRYREVGFNMKDLNLDLKLRITKYKASGGGEYFLEIVNKDNILFGLLRLRIFDELHSLNANDISGSKSQADFSLKKVIKMKNSDNKCSTNRKGIKSSSINKFCMLRAKGNERAILRKEKVAIIRELHVYGPALKLGEAGNMGGAQHTGLGKWLLEEAEEIVRAKKIKELKIISGVGVREYYKKFGYNLEREYMVKKI